MKNKSFKHTELHKQARSILREAGAQCLNGCPGPEAAVRSHLEFWAINKNERVRGLMILQFWEGQGVTTTCEWACGHTWEDLRKCLELDPVAKA